METMIGKEFDKRAKNGKMVRLKVCDEQLFSPTKAIYFLKNKRGKLFQIGGNELLAAMHNKKMIPI